MSEQVGKNKRNQPACLVGWGHYSPLTFSVIDFLTALVSVINTLLSLTRYTAIKSHATLIRWVEQLPFF